jgi:hypothetical protein
MFSGILYTNHPPALAVPPEGFPVRTLTAGTTAFSRWLEHTRERTLSFLEAFSCWRRFHGNNQKFTSRTLCRRTTGPLQRRETADQGASENGQSCHLGRITQRFYEALGATRGHVERLEQIFEALGERSSGKKCAGMEGLIEEGSEVIDDDFEGNVMDAALIGAAQRVEHYEIAAYGTVCAFAELLGETQHLELLQRVR